MFQSEPGVITLRTRRAGAVNLRQRRAWYADEDDKGEGDAETTTDTQPVKKGSGGQGESERTFTQADVDLYLGNARKQARDSVTNELLKELGFEKVDDLKAMVTTAKAQAEAELTELEKRDKEIERLKVEAQQHKEAAAKAQQSIMEERRNTAILSALKQAEKPQSVLNLLLIEHAEEVAGLMDAEGVIDPKKVEALAKKALTEYPGMFRSGGPGSLSNAGGRTPLADKESLLDKLPKVRL